MHNTQVLVYVGWDSEADYCGILIKLKTVGCLYRQFKLQPSLSHRPCNQLAKHYLGILYISGWLSLGHRQIGKS